MAWTLPDLITLATDRTAAYFNKYKACFDVLDQHTHDGTAGGGAVLSDLQLRRDYFAIQPFSPTTGTFNVIQRLTTSPMGMGMLQHSTTNGAVDADGTWSVTLEQGSYTWHIYYVKSTNYGIVDVYFNGTLLNTFDGYASSASANNILTVTATAASSGTQTIRMVVTGRNPSSAGHQVGLQTWVFIKL